MNYSPAIDRKWQARWAKEGLADFDPKQRDRKLYVLEMFSYPSAAKLHVGHWYNYSLADSFARMKKMQGYEVFQPMGFDAFGLPAENYAVKTGVHPQTSTQNNIDTMTLQLQEMGGMFNWQHTLATCKPDYYRWNQWLFLQLYKHGLAYRKNAPVNWCPSCKTVLANEQVMADGSCERCGSLVEQKDLTQWFFKITQYAQELLDELPHLDWPETTKKIQSNWIGRSEGTEIVFLAEKDGEILRDEAGQELQLNIFTTRADTLMGVSYLVIAPDAKLCNTLVTSEQAAAVKAYQEQALHKKEIERTSTVTEKTGVFSGSYAIHPITGQKVPIWVGDYVIASYGQGIVMAVPAHDERDFAFAQKFNLPIKQVIRPKDGSSADLPYTEYGSLFNSGEYDGLDSRTAIDRIAADLSQKGIGRKTVNYRLKDWLVSRQRYWGTPIPMIYCEKCGAVPVPEEELPVLLPRDVEFKPTGDSPLKKCDAFMHTTCPHCGGPALRDPDTLDTFVDSSWYMFRYIDNHNSDAIFDPEKVNAMCPVDVYVGGAEHAAMHLLYSRFITKVLRDLGYLDFGEPFKRLIHQGLILGPDGQKMSKSKGNTLSPDEYVDQYGSDTLRVYLAFGFAFTEGGPWSENGIKAVARFLNRVEVLADEVKTLPQLTATEPLEPKTPADKDLLYAIHFAIQEVTEDTERFQFNTSIARLMELLNALNDYKGKDEARPELLRYGVEMLITLLAPYAPHFTEEVAENLGRTESIFREAWPQANPDFLVQDEVEIAVQVNGKIVDHIQLASGLDRDGMLAAVHQHAHYSQWLDGKAVVKEIPVPGRLINIVVK